MTIRTITVLLALFTSTLFGRTQPEQFPPDSRDSAVKALHAEIARLIAPSSHSAK